MQGYIYLQTMLFAIVNLALCGAAFCDVVSPLNLLVPRPQVVEVGAGMASEAAQKRIVVVRGPVRGAPESAAAEAYRLDIRADGVTLTAEDSRGKRYARATLAQLAKLSGGDVPICSIRDWPAFRWRGYMNDCGRNYLAIDGIKAILDMMSAYKMNLFHWHLSDYHGWRLESKKYPQLNSPNAMLRQQGKYYTQDEFMEVVRYAAERGITVVPELDVPGHTLAFRRGMGIASMSAPGTDNVVSNLIDELCSLVSSKDMPFVHLGTDEVRAKAERCDESWPTKWVRTVNAVGRRAVVWAPGMQIDPSCDVIDMVWFDNHVTNTVNQAIDAARMYNAGWTAFDVLLSSAFKKPCRWAVEDGRKLGAITCTWHDDNVGEDTMKLFRECMVFPSIVAMADNFWHGRDCDEARFATQMPPVGTAEFASVEDLERRLVAQRDIVLNNFLHPFQFVAQTKMRWRVTDCSTGEVLMRDVAQGTLRLKDLKGRVAAETWIFAQAAVECGAWIDLAGINGVYGRLKMPHTPKVGEWDAFGGKVELNDEILPPPEWRQPNMRSTTLSICEQDVPYSNDLLEKPLVDEMPGLRAPYPIRLRKGWNHVRITVDASGKEARVVSFIPILGTETHPREVSGLLFSSDPDFTNPPTQQRRNK